MCTPLPPFANASVQSLTVFHMNLGNSFQTYLCFLFGHFKHNLYTAIGQPLSGHNDYATSLPI